MCFPDWTDPQCGTPKLSRAIFAFAATAISVPETAGLIFVNVTRVPISAASGGGNGGMHFPMGGGGGGGGDGAEANTDVWVSFEATPRTAAPDSDYVCPSGQLRWGKGDMAPKGIQVYRHCISVCAVFVDLHFRVRSYAYPNTPRSPLFQVEILPGTGAEPSERFVIGLFAPSHGSLLGAANATVTIIGGASYANDAADVSIDLLLAPGALPPDFNSAFLADLARALGVGAERFQMMSVSGYGGVTTAVVRILPAAAGVSAVGLYLNLKNDVANPSSALWTVGSLTRNIDPTHPPTAVFLQLPPPPAPPPPPPTTGMSWQSVVLIVLAVVGVAAAAAAWWRRKQLSEWVLWRLAAFRFTSLKSHTDEAEGVELEPATSA